jgi:hypothetical protein
MAYRDFTLDAVSRAFGIVLKTGLLFERLSPAEVLPWLQESLRRGRDIPWVSEKARCELLVMPILLASRELCGNRFTIHSGQRLDVDAERGLTGECDFILAFGPSVPVLQAPVAVILEAKRGDIETGLGQCAAQVVGAREFNRQAGKEIWPLFGCVTTGEDWQFFKLEDSSLVLDKERYYLTDLGRILAAFRTIFSLYPEEAAAA